MSVGYNYHMRVEAADWTGYERAATHQTLDDLIVTMLESVKRADVREIHRVTVYEGNRILLDWGPMHVAVFRAFGSLMPMDLDGRPIP